MVAQLIFANNATTRLYQDTPAGSTTIRVEDGTGDRFPNPPVGKTFTVTLEDRRSGQVEICMCTARSGDFLTVVRAQEGTAGQDFLRGATVSNRFTAGTMKTLIEGAGIPEPAADGKIYARGDLSWVETLPKAYLDPQLALRAPINNPTFTGNPQAPTPAPGDADQSIATTSFVGTALTNLNNAIQAELDPKLNDAPTDGSLYARQSGGWQPTVALGTYSYDQGQQDLAITDLDLRLDSSESSNAAQDGRLTAVETKNGEQDGRLAAVEATNTTQTTALTDLSNMKANIASPVFTGDPQAPTPALADNDTSIATTAFVKSAITAGAFLTDAPVDGFTYGRKNGAWSTVIGGASMLDGPPAGPLQNGQLWFETDSGNTFAYYVDPGGGPGQWVQVAGSMAVPMPPSIDGAIISDTPPASPQVGQMWFESDSGRLFVWYNDGTSQQWVQISGPLVTGFISWPAGCAVDWWGPTAPLGTRFCYGQSLLVASYPALFEVLQYTFGGSGANFSLPDCRGRVIAGKDDMGGTSANRLANVMNGDLLANVGGTEQITLDTNTMPSHGHNVQYSSSAFYLNAGGGGYRLAPTTDGTGQVITAIAVGGGVAHSNLQPTIIANKLICTGGVV